MFSVNIWNPLGEQHVSAYLLTLNLFYKISNDVHVHRLFLDLRCDKRSTPTHPVSPVWHQSFRHTDINKSSISQVIFLFEKSHKPSNLHRSSPRALWSVELHQDNQARFVIPIYYVLTDQGGELFALGKVFFFFNSLFSKNSFQVP